MTPNFSHYADKAPHRLALVAPDGRHWSRAELRAACERLPGGPAQEIGGCGEQLLDILRGLATGSASRATLALIGIDPGQAHIHYCGLSMADPIASTWAIDSLHYGHTVILAEPWDPEKMLHDIERYRVTTSYMLPGQFTRLLALPQASRSAFDVSSIEHVICPVTPCPPALKREMMQWWDMSLYEYSATAQSSENASVKGVRHGNAGR